MLNFYTYFILGVLVCLGAYLLHIFLWNEGWLSTGPVIVLLAGFSLLGTAIGPLRNWKSRLLITEKRLNMLRDTLALYEISFTYDVEIVKRRHEKPEKRALCRNIYFSGI